jgi:hypothetical protein
VIELGDMVPPRVLGIAWHRERALSPSAAAFVEATRARPRRLAVVKDATLSVVVAAQLLAAGSQPVAELLAG